MTLRHLMAALFVLFCGAASLLAHPGSGIAVDRQGRVYFADTGGGVWRIDADRRLTRVNDSRFHWLALDPEGRFASGRMPTSSFGDFVRASADPMIVSSSDFPIAFGGDGALYFSERGRADRRVQLVRWTAAGERSVFAVLPATTERGPLEWINGLAAGPAGSLYYSENTAIRRVSAGGEITTVAVNVTVQGCVEIPGNEPDTGVFLRGLAVTTDGTIYAAAAGCGAVLKITPRGDVTAVVRTASPWSPTAVAIGGNDVYVLEYLHTAQEDRQAWIPRVRRVQADGTVVLLATVSR